MRYAYLLHLWRNHPAASGRNQPQWNRTARIPALQTHLYPDPKTRGYDLDLRRQALKLYVDGTNFRRIARHLSVNHQTVINWVNQAAANLPAPPLPKERQKEAPVETLELDELFTFVSQKKSQPTC